MLSKANVAVVATALASVMTTAHGWWDNGHMLVGEVASQLMTDEDRRTIETVLDHWEEDFPNTNTIATTAIWPDLVKCNKISVFCPSLSTPSINIMEKWHYVNLPMNVDGTEYKGLKNDDLQLFNYSLGGEAMGILDSSLVTMNTTKSLWAANLILRNFIHVFGDLHQPLHTIGGITDAMPKGDAGGNAWKFRTPCNFANLHALWDSAGGDLVNYWSNDTSAMKPALAKNATELIASISGTEDTFPVPKQYNNGPYDKFIGEVVQGKFFQWVVLDSYAQARETYSELNLKQDDNGLVECPSEEYLSHVKKTCRQRIAIGGQRLAVYLTQFARQLRALGLVKANNRPNQQQNDQARQTQNANNSPKQSS